MMPFKVYLGYDPTEHEAWEVAAFSLRRRSSIPVLVSPIYSQNPLYGRTWHKEGDQRVDDIDGRPFSTEFSFARFLVPACEKYSGWALFADCDFLFQGDIAELADLCDPRYAVRVVQHDHRPRETHKMQGQAQSAYPRKNWSSLILWNCGHAKNASLTPDVVNQASGSYLHRFGWLADSEIGALPHAWNWLAGYDPDISMERLKGIHYTLGGPWFDRYRHSPFSAEWMMERADFRAMQPKPMKEPTHGSQEAAIRHH